MSGQETLHKLMVLYMLKRVNFPMSTAELWQYFRGKEYMTEDGFGTLMNGLRDANLIRSEEMNNVLRHELTKAGDEALFYFTSDISDSLKKDMEDYITVNRMQARNETGIATGYEPSGDGGYYVHLKIREEKTVLFVDGPSKRGGADLPADQLYMDSTTPVTRFVSDMLARGRRRIGFIGDWDRCQSLYERYAAFRCAMLMESAPVEKRFCIRTEVPAEIGSALASLSDFPDVFICSDDRTAAEAVGALGRLGRSVPGDVAVCGFGDSPDSRVMAPALTTVHIHTGVMAHAAVQMLLSRIEEPGMDYRIIHTETGLVYRDSAVK
ncbi:MAG: DUF4364 family protein [Lachnospiraceae bacterium]|nr:DUF4364 family protein [Lachnospiraceae bacterium]